MQEHTQKLVHLFGKTVQDNDDDILEKKNILFHCKSVTPEEAIQACGKLLLESGCIEEGYIQAMLARDKSSWKSCSDSA